MIMGAEKVTKANKDLMAEFEFAHGEEVSVNLTGVVVGRSDFEDGPPSYCVEYERFGRTRREWIVGDKLRPTGH